MAGKRANGEGSIFPYRTGYAAYVWVTQPDGSRRRKWVYGKTREEVHDKWLTRHAAAKRGPVVTKVPTLAEYLAYWLAEIIKPNREPNTYSQYELFSRRYIIPGPMMPGSHTLLYAAAVYGGQEFEKLVELRGLEPLAFWMQTRRSSS